jgi:hypothetical protein
MGNANGSTCSPILAPRSAVTRKTLHRNHMQLGASSQQRMQTGPPRLLVGRCGTGNAQAAHDTSTAPGPERKGRDEWITHNAPSPAGPPSWPQIGRPRAQALAWRPDRGLKMGVTVFASRSAVGWRPFKA